MVNTRTYKRFPITGAATLKFKNKGEFQSISTMVGSLSLAGIGLYSDDPIEIETKVSITIKFISLDGIKTESIEGRIIYDEKIGSIHFLGIHFDEEINLKNQPLLHEHIQEIFSSDK